MGASPSQSAALRGTLLDAHAMERLNATVTTVVFKYHQWVRDDKGGHRRAMLCDGGCCSYHPSTMMCERLNPIAWKCTTSAMEADYSLGEFHIGTYDDNDPWRYFIDYHVDGPGCDLSWPTWILVWLIILTIAFCCGTPVFVFGARAGAASRSTTSYG
jgi:hypothetical protein